MFANSAVLSKDPNQLRIPKITPVGEVWLFVDLAQVTSHTPEQVAEMAKSLGYTPELRIAEYFRNGQATLEPVLLVYQGRLVPGDGVAPDPLVDDWEHLTQTLHPSTSVHLRSGTQQVL